MIILEIIIRCMTIADCVTSCCLHLSSPFSRSLCCRLVLKKEEKRARQVEIKIHFIFFIESEKRAHAEYGNVLKIVASLHI